MKIKCDYILREVAGSFVVVATGERSKEFNGMVNLNESGGILWKRAESDFCKRDLVDTLLEHYEVSEEQAMKDVDRFISILKENDFVEE